MNHRNKGRAPPDELFARPRPDGSRRSPTVGPLARTASPLRFALTTFGLAALAACGGGESDAASLREGLSRLPQATPGSADTPAVQEPEQQEPVPPPAEPPMASVSDSLGAGEDPVVQTDEPGEWTAGIVTRRRPDLRPVILREVRSARNEEFDRVVFEFEGDEIPGYHVEYVDRPIRRCGSGEVTQVAGDGWLEVRLTPARAHTEAGEATVTSREQMPGLPNLRELELTCDFEAQVEWVLGVGSPNRYRVLELPSPARLVVDVLR